MNKQRFSPDDLRVASPCTASWGSMTGDERERLCSLCDLHVYNAAAMTRAELAALLAGTEGRLCMRLYRRADGTVITRDCPVGLRAVRRRLARRAGAVLAALLSLGPAVFAQTSKRRGDRKACPVVTTLKIVRRAAAGERGVFGGVVRDVQDAVVAGALVTLTDEETKQRLSTETNSEGQYILSLDGGGCYTVEVEAAGFQKFRAGHVELKAAESARAEVVLQVDPAVVEMGVIVVDFEDYRTPVKTREGTTTINVDALRGVKPRD